MKTTTVSRSRFLPFLALTSALAVMAPGPIRAADTTEGKTAKPGKMMADCKSMMTEKKAMMSAMQTADAALTSQVTAMNNAPAAQKTELMAGVLTALVEQRVAMNAKAGAMSDKMMSHMMGHMEAGGGSMADCPMMKEGGMMKDKSMMKDGSGKTRSDRKAKDGAMTPADNR